MPDRIQDFLDRLARCAAEQGEDMVDLMQDMDLEDLRALQPYIGTDQLYLPPHFHPELDRTSYAWADVSTHYRGNFENIFFFIALMKGEAGRRFLLELIFEPPRHTVDAGHWEYACLNGIGAVARDLVQQEDPTDYLQEVLARMQVLPPRRSRLVTAFFAALNNFHQDLSEDIQALLMERAEWAATNGHPETLWHLAVAMTYSAPEIAREAAQPQLEAFAQPPQAATNVDQLNVLCQLHPLFGDDASLSSAFGLTAAHWLSNANYQEALGFLIQVWDNHHYGAFVSAAEQLSERLLRIASGQQPEVQATPGPPVESIDETRAHMVLFRMLPLPNPHEEYLLDLVPGLSPEEAGFLDQWLQYGQMGS